MGTPDFAVPTLIEIVGRGHEVAAVYTRAPKPAGRGMELQVTPVEREARRFGIPVLTPKTLRNDEALAAFRAHKADAAVVVAYGLILPVPVLEAVPLGCFNLHASLLPRWRGAAPINRAVMAGDAESGVMVMRMAEGLDTGPIAMAERVADRRRHDGGRAARRAGAARRRPDGARARRAGARHLAAHAAAGRGRHLCGQDRQGRDADRLGQAVAGRARPLPRAVAVSRRLVRACRGAGRIKVLRTTRGEGSGAPGTVLDDRLTIACGDGAVRLLEVQRAGKQPMKAEEFLRGDQDRARNARVVIIRSARAGRRAGDRGQFSSRRLPAARKPIWWTGCAPMATSRLALVAEDDGVRGYVAFPEAHG